MWWSPLVALLSSVALAAPVPIVNEQPTWSPDGKWISYSSNRDGSFSIWKTDGVHVRRVVREGYEPAWSPGGRRIAFTIGGGGIALVPAAGGGGRLITRAGYGSEPSWAPDGRRIAFVRPPQGCADGFAIETIRPDGTGEEQVSGSSEFEGFFGPAWSPDGVSVAWVHTDGMFELERGFVRNSTWERFPGTWKRPGRPSWSPDGRFLVFADDRTTPTPAYGLPDGFGPMYVLNVRTGDRRRLTGMWGNRPAWSPGGRRIAFAGEAPGGPTELYLVDADGSHVLRLTRS